MNSPLPPARIDIGGVIIKATPPRCNHPFYEYRLDPVNGNFGITAKLSYDLHDRNGPRTLLRVDSQVASQIFPLQKYASYQVLTALARARQAQDLGNFRVQKGLVVDFDISGVPHPDITVTAHRHGAVPVAVIPTAPASPDFPLEWKNVRLAVYASLPVIPVGQNPLASKADLLRSCNVELDLLLRSYLEEVAGEFFDVEHHDSRRDIFRRLKSVEEIFAASVKPKVTAVLETDKHTNLSKLARDVWRKFSRAIVSAALGRVFGLRLVNELYSHLGVWDRIADYDAQWLHVSNRLRSLSDGGYDDLFPAGSDPDVLRRTREAYLAGEMRELDRLVGEAQDRLWLRGFAEFARFVCMVRSEKAIIGTPRLFVSAQHEVGPSTAFALGVRAYLGERPLRSGGFRAEVTGVAPGTDIEHIERTVKSKVWYSDTVLSVIPKNWEKSEDGREKSLKWIAKEADHALLLGRDLHFFVQQGADRTRIGDEFKRDFGFLSPAKDRMPTQERRSLLPATFEQYGNERFEYNGDAPKISELDDVVDAARSRYARDLVRGFMQQFSRIDQYVLIKVMEIAQSPTKRTELVRRLSVDGIADGFLTSIQEASEALDRARNNSRSRYLNIGGSQVGLVQLVGQSYQGNLRTILERLRPELNMQEVLKWHDKLLPELKASL